MPPKFQKSKQFLQVTDDIEEEILEEYSKFLETFGEEDLVLKDVPVFLAKLRIPKCYYRDINECIQLFYATDKGRASMRKSSWGVMTLLLQALTLSITSEGVIDISDIVDMGKLTVFCTRLLKFRDLHDHIYDAWSLFMEAAGYTSDQDYSVLTLSIPQLKAIKSKLQLDDLSDSILIDMLGCSGTTVDGSLYNYRVGNSELAFNIKDFAEVMGQLGELD